MQDDEVSFHEAPVDDVVGLPGQEQEAAQANAVVAAAEPHEDEQPILRVIDVDDAHDDQGARDVFIDNHNQGGELIQEDSDPEFDFNANIGDVMQGRDGEDPVPVINGVPQRDDDVEVQILGVGHLIRDITLE